MKTTLVPARAAKLIGVGVMASLLLAATGCSAGGSNATAPSATTSPSATAQAAQKPASLRGTLVKVVSGDTVELTPVSDKNGQPTGEPNVTVHILGIKAPSADACGGPEATAELKRISDPAAYYRLTYDPQTARTDAKGTPQGYLTVGDGGGMSMDLGSAMVRNGFAIAWYDSADHAPKTYARDSEATKAAQAQKTGIWATCPAVNG